MFTVLRLSAVTAMAASVLLLSACSEGGRDSSAVPSNSKASPAAGADAALSPSASASPSASEQESGPYLLYVVNADKNGSHVPPSCRNVRWDNVACGKKLTAAAATARMTAKDVIDVYGAKKYPDIKENAGRYVRYVETLKKLGCYGLGPGPEGDQEETGELCVSLETFAALGWYDFLRSVRGE